MNNKKKKNRWLLPLILAVIFVVAVAIIGANIYNLMFGGSVTVSMEDVYSNIAACAPQLVLIGVAVVAVIVISTDTKLNVFGWGSTQPVYGGSGSGGEGMDLPDTYSSDCTYNTTQQGGDVVYSTQEDDIDSSKSYLELSNREIELVERVTSEFSNVIVIINSSNVMEMGWVDEYDNINAVLWVAGAGVNGFEALGEILSGEVNPSGKTVDTWVYDLKNTPTSNNFGEYAYTNSDDINGDTGEVKFVNYVESIYVGY
ncbi:MAG: glycoside hydrolase family 3 C-terminal domain-containing protein, partial [Clostridiales bacterium]|nr:glycoside hydrolase family 3 C-terminal domain-containing protein [Clostridiales bacterium]